MELVALRSVALQNCLSVNEMEENTRGLAVKEDFSACLLCLCSVNGIAKPGSWCIYSNKPTDGIDPLLMDLYMHESQLSTTIKGAIEHSDDHWQFVAIKLLINRIYPFLDYIYLKYYILIFYCSVTMYLFTQELQWRCMVKRMFLHLLVHHLFYSLWTQEVILGYLYLRNTFPR